MRPSNNLENKTPSDTLKCLASMYDSSCSQFFRTTTEIQSGLDAHEESRLFMTFLTSFGVRNIMQFKIKKGKHVERYQTQV